MERFLNLGLMKNPVNWVIITLMVVLGSFAASYLFAAVESAQSTEQGA